jgi:predicted NBD/HSP70 family sugar kinase
MRVAAAAAGNSAMDLGIEIGRSEVNVVLIDDAQRVIGQAHSPVPSSKRVPPTAGAPPGTW